MKRKSAKKYTRWCELTKYMDKIVDAGAKKPTSPHIFRLNSLGLAREKNLFH